MILACAAIDIAAACLAVLCVIGLLSWSWNGQKYAGDDPIYPGDDRCCDDPSCHGRQPPRQQWG